jgi:hypothetical protein
MVDGMVNVRIAGDGGMYMRPSASSLADSGLPYLYSIIYNLFSLLYTLFSLLYLWSTSGLIPFGLAT